MNNKDIYRSLCEKHTDIPLFMQAWWMDAVCVEGKEWDVLLAEENGNIIGAMPFHLIKKVGFKFILQPQLTQYNGVWIHYPATCKNYKRYAFEKKVMNILIDKLEQLHIDSFSQNFHFSVSNWLPFYWKGFKQTTRYTYRIEDISNTDAVFKNFSETKQNHIRKAEKKLHVTFDIQPEQFYAYQCGQIHNRGEKNMLSELLLVNCIKKSLDRNQGFIIAVSDNNQQIHAALFIVYDQHAAYNLCSFINPASRASGASSLVVWEAIKFLSAKTKSFDFEGSMIETVEESFRKYGGIQTPYFSIKKCNSRVLSLLDFFIQHANN